jgi:endo-1,4-beta-xylanase
MKFFLLLLLGTILLAFVPGAKEASAPDSRADSTRGLKDYYRDYFTMGVSVSPQSLQGGEGHLILKQFESLTPENVMKPGPIHPEENRYVWGPADEIAAFAQAHGMKMRGHALCWHEQTGGWFFRDERGRPAPKAIVLKRLKDHITAVVSRYKKAVYAWDVVNEAIDDDSTKFLRNTPWLESCGEEYIARAFEYAHEADPGAQLFYNDYNSERPEKRERIYRLLKKLVDAKVPITGVGLQGHWSIFEPGEQALRETIERFSSLGLKIQVTELDVSIYRWEKHQRERRPGESDVFLPDLERRQVATYAMVFKVFREYRNVLNGVTFWNISDRHTWLDNYPVRGRKNYPLLFDENLRPKKAFEEVTRF